MRKFKRLVKFAIFLERKNVLLNAINEFLEETSPSKNKTKKEIKDSVKKIINIFSNEVFEMRKKGRTRQSIEREKEYIDFVNSVFRVIQNTYYQSKDEESVDPYDLIKLRLKLEKAKKQLEKFPSHYSIF